jgi:hypothetical protein
VSVHTLPAGVNHSATSNTHNPLAVTVKVSAVLSFTADILDLNSFKASPVKATQVDIVVHGALINVAILALDASIFAHANTLPAVVPIEATNVNTCPAIVTVSFAVKSEAAVNTQVEVS